ncbi:MAG: ribosome maturation factor RimP [Acidimicrobiales bacterium]
MTVADELFELLARSVALLGVEVVDVEMVAGMLRLTVDRPGGIDVDGLAEVARIVSPLLDEHDPFPSSKYTLEVSSPGLERPLRTAAHYARAVGEMVMVRTVPGSEGDRRVKGRLTSVDEEGFVLEGAGLDEGGRRIAYSQVERARTLFVWGGSSQGRDGGEARRRSSAAKVGSQAGVKRERITTL